MNDDELCTCGHRHSAHQPDRIAGLAERCTGRVLAISDSELDPIETYCHCSIFLPAERDRAA